MAKVPPPLAAATIMLLRDGAVGLEVFMAVRHHQLDFASGALVFPGGKVEAGDLEPRFASLCRATVVDARLRGLQVAAIREAYEECGILLAADAAGALVGRTRLVELEESRRQIHAGELAFADFLAMEKLKLACDLLVPFARWITPEMMPKRFDAQFYLAPAPSDQVAVHDGHESIDSLWIEPHQAMTDGVAGQRAIVFPTMRNLAKLARAQSVTDALERAQREPVVTVMPWVEQRGGHKYLCIPKQAGYDIDSELLPPRDKTPANAR